MDVYTQLRVQKGAKGGDAMETSDLSPPMTDGVAGECKNTSPQADAALVQSTSPLLDLVVLFCVERRLVHLQDLTFYP